MDMKLQKNYLVQQKLIAVNEYFQRKIGEIIDVEHQRGFNYL